MGGVGHAFVERLRSGGGGGSSSSEAGKSIDKSIDIYDLVTWSRRRDHSPDTTSSLPASVLAANPAPAPAPAPTAAPEPALAAVPTSTPTPAASTLAPAPSLSPSFLRPSLKSSPSHRPIFSGASGSSSSLKNVRFAHQLTTVKRFDTRSEPISISTENSPHPSPLLVPQTSAHNFIDGGFDGEDEEGRDDYDDDDDDDNGDDHFWFGTALSRNSKLALDHVAKVCSNATFNLFDSTLYGESDCDSISDCDVDISYSEPSGIPALKHAGSNLAGSIATSSVTTPTVNFFSSRSGSGRGWGFDDAEAARPRFSISRWHLVSSNIEPMVTRRALDLQSHILAHLQGHNIKLNRISACLDSKKLQGLIYVANLNFEKSLEIKFTFNNWRDVHYVAAHHHRSITDAIDEFKFTIDLAGLSFFMQSKNLVSCDPQRPETCCKVSMNLCCRYDVNGETYYDNNNYNNYHVELQAFTKPLVHRVPHSAPDLTTLQPDISLRHSASSCTLTADSFLPESPAPKTAARPLGADFLLSTTVSHKNPQPSQQSHGRKFSDDTDYYNTSPLKHLFHNDTTLAKPSRINEVTFDPAPSSPMHLLSEQNSSDSHYTHSPPIPTHSTKSSTVSHNLEDASRTWDPLSIRPPLTEMTLPSSDYATASPLYYLANQEPRSLQGLPPPSSDLKKNLYSNDTGSSSQKPTPDTSSPPSSMDYDTLVKSYCFYDSKENSATTPNEDDWKPSYWSRHISPSCQSPSALSTNSSYY